MKNKKALFGTILFLFIFGICFFATLSNINPKTAGFFAFFVVTVLCFLFLWMAISVFFLVLRSFLKNSLPAQSTLRQSAFFSAITVAAMYLERYEYLNLLNIGLLIVLCVMIEIFFISKQENTQAGPLGFENYENKA